MEQQSVRVDSKDLLAIIRTGLWGDANEVTDAEEAIVLLTQYVDQLEASLVRYQMKFGEDVADPLTELRLRLMRGE